MLFFLVLRDDFTLNNVPLYPPLVVHLAVSAVRTVVLTVRRVRWPFNGEGRWQYVPIQLRRRVAVCTHPIQLRRRVAICTYSIERRSGSVAMQVANTSGSKCSHPVEERSGSIS